MSGSVVPEQKGQITFKLEQGNLFVVTGYNGSPNLGFLCLYAQKAEFYHAGKLQVSFAQMFCREAMLYSTMVLDIVRCTSDTPRFGYHLKKTIYPSEDGMLLKLPSESADTDFTEMLSVAVKIERDTTKNVKTFKVAAGIRDGTLDHSVWLPNRSWFTQLLDFFDVTDTPVAGYTPASVITELHLHLWNCAISYS